MKNAKNGFFWFFFEIEILKFPKIPDSEKGLASSRGLIATDPKKGVARDARGRVRRLEPQGKGAFGFFLPVSYWIFVILFIY